jgi:ectoine hydroxylase-related dioxygenase (phytanoyl-CoA dioxygenase family)
MELIAKLTTMDNSPATHEALFDSSPFVTNSQYLRERIAVDGYVFLKGFLEKDIVRALYDSICHTLTNNSVPIIFSDQPTSDVVKSKVKDQLKKSFIEVQKNELLHRLSNSEQLMDIMTRLLNGRIFQLPRKFARIILPIAIDPNSQVRAHQDYSAVKGSVDTLTSWVPLMHCNSTNGALRVLRGSQQQGLIRTVSTGIMNDVAKQFMTDVDPLNTNWLTANFDVGDVLIFHSLTVHEAMLNSSNSIRISVDFRYQLDDQPIDEYMMSAPFSCPTAIKTNPRSWSFDTDLKLPSSLVIRAKESDYPRVDNLWKLSKFYH